MYIYFNSTGTLKEIINDEALRQGNHDVNKIYFFIEGAEPEIIEIDGQRIYKALTFSKGIQTFVDVNGQELGDGATIFSATPVIQEIPYDKKRELKYFKYFTKYQMFVISVPDEVLDGSGTFGCRIQMVNVDTTIRTIGFIVFNVENTGTEYVVSLDTSISIAQYNYLFANMLTMESFANGELENYIEEVLADNTDSQLSNTSENPVQNKVVKQAIDDAISGVYKIQGSATVQELEDIIQSEQLNGYVYNMTDAGSLENHDETTTTVQIGDNVVFVWNEGDWYWDRLSGLVDTSDLVTLNTNQTISGKKSLTNDLILINPDTGATPKLIFQRRELEDSYNDWMVWNQSGYLYIAQDNSVKYYIRPDKIIPATSNTQDLGESGTKWKDLYLSGKVDFGTKVADRTNTVYMDLDNYDGLRFYVNNTNALTIYDNGIYAKTDVIPNANATYNLGSAGKKYLTTYTRYINDDSVNIAVSDIGKKQMTANDFDSTVTYAKGDLVIYNNTLYKMTADSYTAGAFDDTKFTATSVATELANAGGGKVYLHKVCLKDQYTNKIGTFTFYRTSNTHLTKNEIAALLYNNNMYDFTSGTDVSYSEPVSGSALKMCPKLYATNATTLTIGYKKVLTTTDGVQVSYSVSTESVTVSSISEYVTIEM